MKRTFLAIPITIDANYLSWLEKMKKNLSYEKYINWSSTSNMHLTLKFVGDTPNDDIPKIVDKISSLTKRHGQFLLDFDKLGLFGSHYAPRVMWLGLQNESSALNALEEDVLSAFDELGYLRDRQNFVPHLTICRIKKLVDKQFFFQIFNSQEQKSRICNPVKELVFYQSILLPQGAMHKVIKRFELK